MSSTRSTRSAACQSKDPDKEGLQFPGDYIIDRPNVETYLKEMNQQVLTPYAMPFPSAKACWSRRKA
jgi:hypothetical protein